MLLSLRRAPSLSARMARWGLVIVVAYALVALLTPLLVHAGWLADPNSAMYACAPWPAVAWPCRWCCWPW